MKHPASPFIALFVFLAGFTSHGVGQLSSSDQIHEPTKVRVNGVDLHYIERGKGATLILLHGGQSDYRSWGPQIEAFFPHYRVISYSRRYNYPNDNPLTSTYRSAYTDAEDLAALIRHLKLESVHLVGTSVGALTALLLAMQHPEMVHSMVLAEPPAHGLAKSASAGTALYTEFMTSIWKPAADAFKRGDEVEAMRIFVDGFGSKGRFDALPIESRTVALQNARFFKASTSSSDPFPEIPEHKIRGVMTPILLVTGENTIGLHRFVNDALGRLLPKVTQVTIPRAGHGSARENPSAFNEAVSRFLKSHTQYFGERRPNKAPEPTPGSVTPRATEGTSK
jgi:pimeloyl-ACP methyl ester carboxylesterase